MPATAARQIDAGEGQPLPRLVFSSSRAKPGAWLGKVMPYLYAPIVLIVISGLLMIVGATIGPETRQVELHLPDLGRLTGSRAEPPLTATRS